MQKVFTDIKDINDKKQNSLYFHALFKLKIIYTNKSELLENLKVVLFDISSDYSNVSFYLIKKN